MKKQQGAEKKEEKKRAISIPKVAEVCVIGAGASGFMAAISAAREGASVLVLEHTALSGKKILSTGNGRCNFTNTLQTADCYRSDDPKKVEQCLAQFGVEDTLFFFRGLGVLEKEKNGYYYPNSNQATTIRKALLSELYRLQIPVVLKAEIRTIDKRNGLFFIQRTDASYNAKSCIVCTGGAAASKTGSDGSGYVLAKQLGHSIIPPLAALVPLVAKKPWHTSLAGVRCDGRVTLFVDQKEVASDTGELQFTDYGVSGIPIFQVSRYAARALLKKQQVTACIDFLPAYSTDDVYQMLLLGMAAAKKSYQDIVNGLLPEKLSQVLCEGLPPLKQLEEDAPDDAKQQLLFLAKQIKCFSVAIAGTKPLEQAQVTCGGVPLLEVDDTLQSQLEEGLYFAGEVLNVDGICGGYNLQWAWSSGYVAGTASAKASRRDTTHE